jgi:TolB protein
MKYVISMFLLGCILYTPVLSFSGERIAFSSYQDGSWQIWSIDPDGNNLSQLTHTEQDLHYPAWSPDGQKIAYSDNEGELWIMKIGESPRKVSNLQKNCNHPSWSPNGNKVAFVCYFFKDRMEDSDIWMADLQQGKVLKLMEQEGIQSYPAWSSDGSTIVYTTGYRISSDKVIEELWLVNSDGKNPRPLVSNNFSNIQPDWSPDGEKIASASDKSGNMDIWVVDKYARNMKQLTFDKSYDADPSWSLMAQRYALHLQEAARWISG